MLFQQSDGYFNILKTNLNVLSKNIKARMPLQMLLVSVFPHKVTVAHMKTWCTLIFIFLIPLFIDNLYTGHIVFISNLARTKLVKPSLKSKQFIKPVSNSRT